MSAFVERLRSARFVVFILTTIFACIVLVWIVGKASPDTVDKIALVAVGGFFGVWGQITTFYFTRQDRGKVPPQ